MSRDWEGRIAVSVLDGFGKYFSSGTFTDTQIHVEGEVFHCHKVFLCAISDYFRAMFLSGMRESLDGRVSIDDKLISGSLFRDILSFYYNGKDSVVTAENAEDLLRAASILQMNCLIEKCEDFYLAQLTSENAWEILKLAKCLNSQMLYKKTREFITSNYESVSKEAEFLASDFDDLSDLLISDDLRIQNEDVVCESVIRWLGHSEDRYSYAKILFGSVRLKFVSNEFLKMTKTFCEENSELNECIPLICNSIEQRSKFHFGDGTGPSPRNFEEILITIGVKVSSCVLPRVNGYSFQQKTWFALESLPLDPGVGFAVCTCNNDVFISGGSGRKSYLLQYISDANVWRSCPDMVKRRSYHAMVSIKDNLYVIGGCNRNNGALESIDTYNTIDHTWSDFGDLQLGVYSISSTVLKDQIFIFGGRGQSSRMCHEIQMIDVNLRTSSIISAFSSPVTESRALSINDDSLVVLTNGSVLKVLEDGAVCPVATIPNFDRYNFGVSSHQNSLIILGGETRYPSDTGTYDDLIIMNLTNGQIEIMPDKLYPGACAFGCIKILMKRAFLASPSS
ncbi:hypothetical protein SNE40_011935 [Patella caerulea]|uniref:BTB domain-containing protein n=1 Tax=Patella caerulea TaxID=87958 RepID=A0AAN8JT95_PATCE